MHDHQNDSDSCEGSMEHPASFTCGVSAAPSAPALPAAEQLDRNPGVATRIMDKLKNMSRGRCLVLTTVCLGIICVFLLAVIIHQQNIIMHQQNKIKEQIDQNLKQTDNSNVFWVGSLIIKVAKLWIDPSGTLGTMLSFASEVVDMVKSNDVDQSGTPYMSIALGKARSRTRRPEERKTALIDALLPEIIISSAK